MTHDRLRAGRKYCCKVPDFSEIIIRDYLGVSFWAVWTSEGDETLIQPFPLKRVMRESYSPAYVGASRRHDVIDAT
jgi:hypothetical protein